MYGRGGRGGTMRAGCMAVCELSYSVSNPYSHPYIDLRRSTAQGPHPGRESRSLGMLQTTSTRWMPWDAYLTSPCALGVDSMLLGLSTPTPCAPVPYSRPYTHTAPYSPNTAIQPTSLVPPPVYGGCMAYIHTAHTPYTHTSHTQGVSSNV